MRILGVDFGNSRTGVAISDELGLTAQPLETITERDKLVIIKRLMVIAKENNIDEIVVGMPVNMDGTLGARAIITRKFGEKLEEKSEIPVKYMDERLSTVSAGGFLNECDVYGKKRKKIIDMVSAVIILQNYIDKNK
ncbi:MAG: Holliday junction resolvase RuvX [Clostridiales bacterium]|jgi:putative Holliday junction resolvase|nr:Holliday junction resolvase RuvX [Clostridiales bacterium]